MNPFMMSNMFFGPMGMSISPMCGCGVSMPFYGMNDGLTFMNFPVFRNTSNDYLLNPMLAYYQSQQQMQFGMGNMYGNTMLPLFNNFPGMSMGPMNPWGFQRTETPEQKEKREAREAEGKKPEAAKATALKNTFDKIKKLSEENKDFLTLDKSIIDKANEAMKKETAEERLQAMKEVIALIPDEKLKIALYSDDKIRKNLRVAGFNFTASDVKNKDIKSGDADNIDALTTLHDELQSKNYNQLQILGGQLNSKDAAKDIILSVISNWNDKYHGGNDKGILRWIASNAPEGQDAISKKDTVNACVLNIVQALEAKAGEYKGCPKVEKALQNLLTAKQAMINAKYSKTSVYNVATAFDALYVRLRMQEAVKVNKSIQSNSDYKALNDAKEGFINDNLVVAETIKDIESEGFTNHPKVSDLDEIKTPQTVTVGAEGVIDCDKEYEGKPQELIDEYLVGEANALTKVGNTNVYQTKGYNDKGNGVKYYTVKDNKIVRCTRDGKEISNAAAVTGEDIKKYDETVSKIKEALDNKAIEPCNNFPTAKLPYPVFKATASNEYYALRGNEFYKIKKCTGLSEDINNKKIHATGTNKTLDKLSASDFEVADPSSIKSKAEIDKDKKEKEQKAVNEQIQKVTSITFSSLKDAKTNKQLDVVSKAITGKDGQHDFKALKVNGYFYSNSTKRFYRYNGNTNQLVYLKDVVEVNKNGYLKYKNGTIKECQEVVSDTPVKDAELVTAIQEYGKKFAKDVNGKSSADEDSDALRKLNTIVAKNDPIYTINFIKGYKDYGGFWSNDGICKQIVTENGFENGNNANEVNTKKHYVREFAKLMLKAADITNFDRESEDYALLQKVAKGYFVANNVLETAVKLDKIIEKVLKEYEEMQS